MTNGEIQSVLSECAFPKYTIYVAQSSHGYTYIQACYVEADTITGDMEMQYTRRWSVNPMMTKSEIVATAFKCVLTSMEHKTREWFLYRGKAIYQPHYDVDVLHSVCEERSV